MSGRLFRWVTCVTVMVDATLINVAFGLSYWFRYGLQWFKPVDAAYFTTYDTYVPIGILLTVILLISYNLEGVYRPARGRPWFDELYTIFSGTTTGIALMMAVFYFYQPAYHSRLIFVYALAMITALLGISRLVRGVVLRAMRRRGLGVDRVLIVGAGETGRTIMRNLVAQPGLGYQVAGFVDDDPDKAYSRLGRFDGLGTVDELPTLLTDRKADEVIITLPWMYHRKILSLVEQCQRARVRVRIVPDLFQMSLGRVDVHEMNGIPLIGLQKIAMSTGGQVTKRIIDVIGATVILLVLSPLMLLVAAAIRLESSAQATYSHERVGKNGRRFTAYKFRSMCQEAEKQKSELDQLNEADGPLFKIQDDPRVTRLGRILRRTSIDELPQLINVVQGDMSLIGPRPHLPEEVAQYEDWHRKRLQTAPGMAGLAQVSGRSSLTFDETVMLDLYYIENWSLGLDLRIALRTIPKVIFGDGAY